MRRNCTLSLIALLWLLTGSPSARAQGLIEAMFDDCPSCQAIAPTVAQLRLENHKVVQVDVLKNDLHRRVLGVTRTPTFIAYSKSGHEVGRLTPDKVNPRSVRMLLNQAEQAK